MEGWRLTGLSCTSQSGSTTATDIAARRVQISLVAGDTVTCTFTNRLTPPAGALVLRKVTRGGTGSFPFRIRNEDGDVVARRELTTRSPGGTGAARVIKLDPGRYRISERRPASGQGMWRLTGVKCNGSTRDPASGRVRSPLAPARGAVCTFTNRLDRPGRIIVRAVTIGGLDTAGYVVTPFSGGFQRRQFATTRRQGAPAEASGEPTRGLPFGRYVVQETAISAGQREVWSLVAVLVQRQARPVRAGPGDRPRHAARARAAMHVRQPAPARPRAPARSQSRPERRSDP